MLRDNLLTEEILMYVILFYVGIMSVIGFSYMVVDKYRAVKQMYRIPERTLFLIAWLGGLFN